MKMNLSTGLINPQGEQYGIENLKRIVLAVAHIRAALEKLKEQPIEKPTFWNRVKSFFARLFGSYASIEQVMQDLAQIYANKELILAELQDLKASEVQDLCIYAATSLGIDIDKATDFIKTKLPTWLQGWINL